MAAYPRSKEFLVEVLALKEQRRLRLVSELRSAIAAEKRVAWIIQELEQRERAEEAARRRERFRVVR